MTRTDVTRSGDRRSERDGRSPADAGRPPGAARRAWRALRRPAGAAALILALAAVAACSDALSPDPVFLERGILRFEPAAAPASAASTATDGPASVTEGTIDAPDQVQVGETFLVRVSTVGLDGCWEPVDAQVAVEGLTATVEPLDSRGDRENVACTQALEFLEHPVELSFAEAGEAVIRVEGRSVVGREEAETTPITLEATVQVVP